jgi:hypothetical protein
MAKITADFTNVKESSGFNPKQMPEGDYTATIVKADLGKSNAGNKQVILGFQLNDSRTAVYPYYCGLDANVLWKLRTVLIAAGIPVPKKKVSIDTDKLIGKEVGISLEDDEYEGKMKSVIMGVFPADDVDSEGLPTDDDSDVEDDEIEEDEVEEEEEEAPAPKARARKAKAAPVEEPEEDEAEEEAEEEEEEEEPAPAPKRRAKAKPAPVEETEDEDDDLDLDDL